MMAPIFNVIRTIWREFERFVTNSFGTFLFCVVLGLILAGAVGTGMGIPGLFRNPAHISSWYLGNGEFSPAFWTAFFVYYLSFMVFVIVRFWESRSASRDAADEFNENSGHHSKHRKNSHALRRHIWENQRRPASFVKYGLIYALKFRRPFFLHLFLMLCWTLSPQTVVVPVLDILFGSILGWLFSLVLVIISLFLSNLTLTEQSFQTATPLTAKDALFADGIAQLLVAFGGYFVLAGVDWAFPVNVYIFLFLTLTFMLANFAIWWWNASRWIIIGLAAGYFLVPLIVDNVILASICVMLAATATIWWSASRWFVLGIVAGFVLVPANEFTFDGILDQNGEPYYAQNARLTLGERRVDLPFSKRIFKPGEGYVERKEIFAPLDTCSDETNKPDLLMPTQALENWRRRMVVEGRERRKMVIVATSGGAYRAAYWTAMIVDELKRQSDTVRRTSKVTHLANLDESIRLVTGASGGMVAGAYFTALADNPQTRRFDTRSIEAFMDSDIRGVAGEQADQIDEVPRDSLTRVARQLMRQDIPGLFFPFARDNDRGKALERQWEYIHGINFGDLVHGERAGWRPSIIFSPMLVETGEPLLISNLNLQSMQQFRGNESQIFFDLFPCSQHQFNLATAVRMNATFPYITPAVSLPTDPERRVVDAGYYDNFGMATATAYLSDPKVRKWIMANIDDVIIIEIRAFPTGLAGELACSGKPHEAFDSDAVSDKFSELFSEEEWYQAAHDGDLDARERYNVEGELYSFFESWKDIMTEKPSNLEQMEWLTNPIEAAISARSASMVFRNSQALDKVRLLYEDKTRISSVVFVNNSKASLNWYLTSREIESMRACFENQWSLNYQTLVNLWNAPPRELDDERSVRSSYK